MTEVYCIECNDWFKADYDDVYIHEVSCEDCGSHYAWKCPKCEELIDNVYAETR